MTWQEYEKEVFKNIADNYPYAEFEFNSKVTGQYSKGKRQCDVIIRQKIKGVEYVTLVDAKYYSKKIDVKAVDSFISMSKDINADFGILVTPIGYSELAYNRAENDTSSILLDILTLKKLKQFQGYYAIPYAGDNGVILSPAFGWIIDATQKFNMVASSFRIGFDFDQAFKEKEFIYFGFWNTVREPLSAKRLLENQVELISEKSQVIESKIEQFQENSKNLFLRKTITRDYLAVEYACALEYEGFIFFGILISPENRESVNRHKLIQMVARTIPVQLKH